MDIDLGRGIDGTDAAALILKDKDLPVVFLSSHTEPEIVNKTEKITSYGYVVKSSSITVLDASIKMAFKLFDANLQIEETKGSLQSILENMQNIYYKLDANGKILELSSSAVELYEYDSLEEMIGKSTNGFVYNIDDNDNEKFIEELYKNGYVKNYPIKHKTKTGKAVFVETNTNLIFDKQGNPIGIVGVFHDVTDLKQLEAKLLKLGVIIEQSHEAIVITNLQGDIEYVNPKFCSLSGYSREELIGSNSRVLQSGQTPKETFEELWETVLQGKVWNGEFLNKKKNGELYWENAVISPIYNDSGDITHFVGIKEDISTQKQAIGKNNQNTNLSLDREYKSFYQMLVEDLPVLICRYTKDGNILFTNKNYCNFIGKTAEELLGSRIFDLIGEDNIERAKKQIAKLSYSNRVASHIHNVTNAAGEVKLYKWIDHLIITDTERVAGYLAIGIDVSGNKQA